MRRLALLAPFVAALAWAAPAPAQDSPLSIGPIEATFVQKEFSTHYSVEVVHLQEKRVRYRWTLELELVDPAGAKNPTVPDSAAAVDLACDNHKKLVGTADEFVWRHGDGPIDGCDHTKMGPKGHQGSVVLVVTDGTWLCTAEYKGTNDGRGQRPRCGKDDVLAASNVRKAIDAINESIALERAALEDLKATPPRLAAAYDKTDRGRMKLHDADDLVMKSGAWDGGDVLRGAWLNDLEVLWNINIPNSPYVPKSPLDVEANKKRLTEAIAAKERELARLRRVLRTQH